MARVLDLGCGDGFLIDRLCPASVRAIEAVDIYLTVDQVATFAAMRPRVTFHNSYASLTEQGYSLITMFDVLEHVEDDAFFLQETVSRLAAPGAHIFCTVPAFQTLFSAHDTFLHHQRRYSLAGLTQFLERAGFTVLRSGYLFATLLPIRALAVVVEQILGAADLDPGIGHWQRGPFMTALLTAMLDLDNSLLRWLGRLGIKCPGLTVWAICQLPR
jgi:hypothetical protein